MRLSDFILANIEPILANWEVFARSAVAGAKMWTRVEGSAPNRRFVVEMNGFDYLYCGGMCTLLGARTTDQIILYESGDIEFHYGPRTAPTNSLSNDIFALTNQKRRSPL